MKLTTSFALLLALAIAPVAADAAIIGYWNQNTPALPSGAFGYVPGDFPQPADAGNGSLSLANFITTTGGADGAYTTIQSFGGTTDNAQFGDPAGGALSPQPGPSPGFANNGMQILLSVDTTGFEDIEFSWAQRGTGTGFTSRAFAYSADGGANFTPLSYTGDTGALGATFAVVGPDLSTAVGLNDNPNVVFRLTLGGGTGATGNNRFDNFLIEGTAIIPEPASLALLGLASVMLGCIRRRS